jgi:glycosyltransferase involved in cell wall biosynthesis
MALTIVSVAYPFAPVTPDPAGGAEQVLAQLDRALVEAGHRSIVVACEGSSVAGELVVVPGTTTEIDDARRAEVHAEVRVALARVLAEETVDLVHLHGIDFAAYPPPAGVRTLVTLHLPLDWYPAEALGPDRPDLWLVPVSESQARRAPAGARLLAPIGNGIDLDRYRPTKAKADHAVVIGRIAPEKGQADAIAAAKLAGVALVVAGPVFPYPAHRRYFDEEVVPRLDADRRWVGAVAGEAKRRLLAEAWCVLIPSTAPETSSLVAMEALASGTPVIAYRSGALPDIVEDGVTGLLVDDVAEMAEAIGRVGDIDPDACRRAAEERFDVRRTTAAYLDLYHRLAA